MDRHVQCPQCEHEFDPAAKAERESAEQHHAHDVQVEVAAAKPKPSRFTRRGLAMRIGVVAAVLLIAAFALYPLRWLSERWFAPPPDAGKPVASLLPKTQRPLVAHSLDEAMDRLEKSVVLLETVGVAGDTSVGSGFVIDKAGLVATNFHVVAHATQAFASFRNGERFRVVGLAAVEPERDLAIIRLEAAPLELTPAELAADDAPDPKQLAPVVALGHPNGVAYSPYDGKVSRIVRTSQLPRHSQRFLQKLLSSTDDATWIQHTARLSDGNSGGPLLNASGQVIGVNTWVDRQSQFSYALHVKHLLALRAKASGSEMIPLGAASPRDGWVTRWLNELTAENLRQLYDGADGFRFQPASNADYRQLQKLAWAVTVANAPSTLTLDVQLEKQLESLEAETDRVIARLSKQRWDGPAQILLINEFAAEQVESPLAGVFVIGTVVRVVKGDDGASGVLMKISGTDKTFFTPLVDRLFSAPVGSPVLVLGVNYNGRSVRYGENPLKLNTAPVVVAGALLRL